MEMTKGIGNSLAAPYPTTYKQRLEQEVKSLDEKLSKAKEALEILERNPDIERLLSLLNNF